MVKNKRLRVPRLTRPLLHCCPPYQAVPDSSICVLFYFPRGPRCCTWQGEGNRNFQTYPLQSPTPFSANHGTDVPLALRKPNLLPSVVKSIVRLIRT